MKSNPMIFRKFIVKIVAMFVVCDGSHSFLSNQLVLTPKPDVNRTSSQRENGVGKEDGLKMGKNGWE